MVAPYMESSIKLLDDLGNEIQPAVTGETNAYFVSGADKIDYEIRTYADNGRLASDYVEIELYEVKTNEAEDELIINTLVWRELQTDSNGYLQGNLKVPWWAANKILGFAITYGYDDSLNISERQKLKQARNKIILKGADYAVLIAGVALIATGVGAGVGAGLIAAGRVITATEIALVITEIAYEQQINNRQLGKNKYGDKFDGLSIKSAGLVVSPLTAELKRKWLLNMAALGATISAFMLIRKHLILKDSSPQR